MTTDLRRGNVVWAELDPVRGREQSRRRPVLIVASDLYLTQADTLAIIVPATTKDRGWPNHVELRGSHLDLTEPTFAMTEQPRTVARERLHDLAGTVNAETMREVDRWLRDFLGLP
ncbi:MAG: type II toxin-antitoxin system PemK/MazF family toxin [Mycolicibacterium insubricum]|nr:type II toxin-antitoxin system PemK/MazF family toxin [Mycobacterium sp.]